MMSRLRTLLDAIQPVRLSVRFKRISQQLSSHGRHILTSSHQMAAEKAAAASAAPENDDGDGDDDDDGGDDGNSGELVMMTSMMTMLHLMLKCRYVLVFSNV